MFLRHSYWLRLLRLLAHIQDLVPEVKAIETGMILLIAQAAAVIFVKRSLILKHCKIFDLFTKPFQEFEPLTGAADWYSKVSVKRPVLLNYWV